MKKKQATKQNLATSIQEQFVSPGALYRGKPFWAWNGRLDPEELRRQVRVMHRMGLGGFFMHSRVGLDTAYLSEEWFDCIRACIDEAKELGMEAWLYDEDRWPSGAAGGLVTKNPRHRERHLKMSQLAKPADLKWTANTLAAFTLRRDGLLASDVKRIPKGKRPARIHAGEILVVFTVETSGCSSWYNGYTYLDTMSHEAVREFIKVTHEAYRKEVGKAFGKTVPGMFTDEPNNGAKMHAHGDWPHGEGPVHATTAWTPKLPVLFRQRYGYDLIERLPEIFLDLEGQTISRARYHYHDCCTFLFVDAFARQIGEWCEKNRMMHTGHVLEEDSLYQQTAMVGNCMRFYEYMQAPGMDLLTDRWNIKLTAKQVSSAARQFARTWRLTETYGCTGWDFAFEGHKALGDWQTALGINLRCQHLSWYTMEGEAKRDYPASIFYQSPWWEVYGKVEDYYARINAVMTRGQEVRDLLVIHPVESAWVLFNADPKKGSIIQAAVDGPLEAISDSLLFAHIDFDYGDEEIMSRHGYVRVTADGVTLCVGKAVYKAVIVPPMKTMRYSTWRLLWKFKRAGGLVIFAGDAPEHVDAKRSAAVLELALDCPKVAPGSAEMTHLAGMACRRLSITTPGGAEVDPALYLLREDEDAFYLFICNTSRDWQQNRAGRHGDMRVVDRKQAFPAVHIHGFVECEGAPIELDPETGLTMLADAIRLPGCWQIRTSLPRLGSRLFVIPKQAGWDAAPRPVVSDVRLSMLMDGHWDIALSEPNVLVLDKARYAVDGEWEAREEILRIDGAIRRKLGVPERGGHMVQPWAQPARTQTVKADVQLMYSFQVDALPSGDLFLALERPAAFRIRLNGQSVSTDADSGWWVDKSLRTIRLDPALLRTGENVVELQWAFDESHPGLEIMYLLGTFGVTVDGDDARIGMAPARLTLGDWVPQGLPFYSGSVTYRKSLKVELGEDERLFVRVPGYAGTGVRVWVDGVSMGVTAWHPNEVEITDRVRGRDSVELGIQLLGHRRNSHGPLHLTEKWPWWTGPGEYHSHGDRWREDYSLVPCGLMKAPELVVRR